VKILIALSCNGPRAVRLEKGIFATAAGGLQSNAQMAVALLNGTRACLATPRGGGPATTAPPAPPKSTTAARYVGSLSRDDGSVRFRIAGDRVTHASAVVRNKAVVLRGSDVNDSGFKMYGAVDGNYIKLAGRVRRGARWISGTWNGVVDGKKVRGQWTAVRR
jgi:hypothetical protein